jgi:hypothetical protein
MSPLPGFGHKTYLQFGPHETNYGTFIAPTKKLEVVSWNVAPVVGVIQEQSLYNQQSRRALYQGGLLFKGTFVVRLNYEGLEELFRAVTGSYTAPTVDGAVQDHKFTEGLTLNSLAFEVIKGNIRTGTCFRLLGSKLLSVAIRATAGTGNDAMLLAEFTVVGQQFLSNQTPTGSLAFSNLHPVLYHHGFVYDDGTASGIPVPLTGPPNRIKAIEITLDNPHDEARFFMGLLNPDEPVRNDFIVARMRITQEFNDILQFDAARAFTVGSPRFVFKQPGNFVTHTSTVVTVNANNTITRGSGSFITDGWQVGDHVDPSAFVPSGTYVTTVAALTLTLDTVCLSSGGTVTVTGGTSREFEARMNSAQLVEYTDPIDNYGPIISTATWEGVFDVTDQSAMFMRFRNSQAALAG